MLEVQHFLIGKTTFYAGLYQPNRPNAVKVWFGAQPARFETPVRAAAKRRPSERGVVERRQETDRKYVSVINQIQVVQREAGSVRCL